jgi:hypothetical protein
MSYVIVSVISLLIGGAVGVATLALCIAGKNAEIQKKEDVCYNCYGCFGASYGDCDNCPRNKLQVQGDEDEK